MISLCFDLYLGGLGSTFAAKITPHKRSHERDLLRGISKGCLRVGTWETERQTASEQERENKRVRERQRDWETENRI